MRTYIILVNWNGWKDTIECLESVLRLSYPDFRVVVCDNYSSDGSLEYIKAWARGELTAPFSSPVGSRKPGLPKPIPYRELTYSPEKSLASADDSPLVLIQTGANYGFAGGNNVGLRYASGDPDCEFLWLLNNDCLADPNALSALVARAVVDPAVGVVGSVCYYASQPHKVQSWGGARVNLWNALVTNSVVPRPDDWFDYIYGASFLFKRQVLDAVGLMDDRFFMYFEEAEYCFRIRRGGWNLAVASGSRVLHKVNASTGGNHIVLDRYFTASGMRLLRSYSRSPHLAILIFVAARLFRRGIRFQWARWKSVLQGMQDFRQRPPRNSPARG